ncbi:DUF6153 family protein [Streptomyces sp. NPDC026206]|uniref:DUF6153 family protein n=1 Tax=Streptomyces sp. NPDC026206 TaxID=3157089 RepID=UPI0033E3F62B
MTSTRQSARPLGARFVLLVLAVLAGIVAMHGLGPGGAMPAHGTVAGGVTAHDAAGGCHHVTPDGSRGGHIDHADATCAAVGISGGPELPAPAATVIDEAPVFRPAAWWGVPASGGRAPPSLSELQLLRI